jgi:diguanylate cyclase (GGDEF)-like protein
MTLAGKTTLTDEQQSLLWAAINAFHNDLNRFQDLLTREFGFVPGEFDKLVNHTQRASHQIRDKLQVTNPPGYYVDNDLLPLIKRAILMHRRKQVQLIQARMKNATDLETLGKLANQVQYHDMFNDLQWFQDTQPVRLPRLTDYFTLKRAEEIIEMPPTAPGTKQPKKTYADKFPILWSSSSVDPELEYWRNQCDLREVGLALAYFDIDNFKQDFNTPYTETVIDRNCLPVILRAIEAHAFIRGFAYHEGGDEFIILLPNISKEEAVAFMDRLRLKLPTLKFVGVDAKTNISVGICHIAPDCPLTDTEVRRKGNDAKKYAKEKGGKNCIATYTGERYVEGELAVVAPSQPA